jgi:hypothetical protein
MRPASLAFRVLKFALIGVLSCIVLVVAFEAAVRLALPDLMASWRGIALGNYRVVFVSHEAFQNKAGYFTFRPDSEIREVAYYPDAKGDFTPEYDCTYASDRLGFLSNTVAYEESEILLLGDSYSQGVGGCAWLPRLAPAVHARIYSAAIMGTGVAHWRNMLADLERIKAPKKILIVFITQDFYRDDWVFAAPQLACLAGRGPCRGQFWYPISEGMGELAAERLALRQPRIGKSGMSKLLRYHLTAGFTLFEKLKRGLEGESRSLSESVAIIEDMARRYPVKLIWVNEKGEAGGPGPRTRLVWGKLEGLDVTRCNIPAEGFLARDAHPNAKGYGVLKDCVARVVANW